MAQAARLSSRMHKELKLLLSDPPPGATFPYLSSAASLTAIDAQIEGPEGTVYENGYFHIKIQIPERYPFQPPLVTFATPIYHPNIDTGGRICLDILNLPPKGAWQPSLNISTVLTSIGLLLSEPNPDDGLMCEASKEYKYNRRVFDQKARSMTQKYAKPLSGGSSSSRNEDSLLSSNSNQGDEGGIKHEVRSKVNNLNLQGPSRKLSLQSSGSNNNPNQPSIAPFNSQMETERRLESKCDPCYNNENDLKLFQLRRKLSLKGSRHCLKSSDETNTMSQNVGGGGISYQDVAFDLGAKNPVWQKVHAASSSLMKHEHPNKLQVTQPASTSSCPNLPKTSTSISLDVDSGEIKPPVDDKKIESHLTVAPPYFKHQLSNKKLCQGYPESEENSQEDNKENIPALHQPRKLHLVSSSVIGKHSSGRPLNPKLISSNQGQGVRKSLSLGDHKSSLAIHESSTEVCNSPNKGTCQQVSESEPPISSEAIVLDSEDEEERDEPIRSKVMIPRRRLCLAGKRKSEG